METPQSRHHVLWATTLALHIFCGTYPLLVGMLYIYMIQHAQPVVENAELYSVTVPQQHFRTIAAVYFAVAALHFATAIVTLLHSLRHRQLRFDGPATSQLDLEAS
ncbi:hypothetical protein P43SY_001839 [Pythium insidiosum]|uniref:Transmembrane protein n=1 Tax=Pythium insidiosum TaxID=114742 RepID=A0AAD5Q5B2_PYTIN|nr:hypothetical protein P43SY_001839 [Pythium insidiosum]